MPFRSPFDLPEMTVFMWISIIHFINLSSPMLFDRERPTAPPQPPAIALLCAYYVRININVRCAGTFTDFALARTHARMSVRFFVSALPSVCRRRRRRRRTHCTFARK